MYRIDFITCEKLQSATLFSAAMRKHPVLAMLVE
jgi:hypothetical protein